MKIHAVRANNRRKVFEVRAGTKRLVFPFAKLDLPPSTDDPIVKVFVDRELGGEGFTYVLRSGREGSVHVEDVLEYNQDPDYLRDLLLYRLTLEAQKRVAAAPLAKREIIRRLKTSPTQSSTDSSIRPITESRSISSSGCSRSSTATSTSWCGRRARSLSLSGPLTPR